MPSGASLSAPARSRTKPGAFHLDDFSVFPEVTAVFNRYFSQARWELRPEGCTVIAPTSFHAEGLKAFQPQIEAAIGHSVRAFVMERPSAAAPAARAAQPAPVSSSAPLPRLGMGNDSPQRQTHLALFPRSPSVNPQEAESSKRAPAPFLQSSPSLAVSQQLVKNWVGTVNAGQGLGQTLWLFGPSGCGKTTLLKQFSRWVSLDKRLLHNSVMPFFHEWRQSLESQSHLAFVRKYRKECEVLVLENLDDLQGKEKTQDEVLFTVQGVLERGGSVAVSSTLHPLQLKDILQESLFSRLFSGLIIEMPKPDRAFKELLWRHLLEQHGMAESPTDFAVQERLFGVPVNTVRDVQKLFINAISRLSLNGQLDMDEVARLENFYAPAVLSRAATSTKRPLECIDKLTQLCGVGLSAIQGKSRRADIAIARRFVCLALSKHLGLTNSAIAAFVAKDPSTVSYCLKTAEEDIANDRHVAEQWNWLCSQMGFNPTLS